MSGIMHRKATEPDGTGGAVPHIALDAHVHLYPGADPTRALAAGWDNLDSAARAAGYLPDTYCLLLTETERDDAFGALADGRLAPQGWTIRPLSDDRAALQATRRQDNATLLIVAGRQIVTQERIEVLALATTRRIADGRPIRTVLDELRHHEIPADLPWGVGKWFGARGRTVATLLAGADTGGLMLGDNAGRPVGWRTPPLFGKAATRGLPVLPGSDPLPLPGTEREIGSFGCLIEGDLDPDRPAADLRARLFALRSQPIEIGRRRGPRAVIAEQIALRRRNLARPGPGRPA